MKMIKNEKIKYPGIISLQLKDLLELLLEKNPHVRLIKAAFDKIKES
jgi:hypothetical protein